MTDIELPRALDSAVLPAGVRARFIDNVNGLRMQVLEAGFQQPGRPALLLLHGFPELAYSWRKVMPALSDAGYYVIAPDQRGYGRTTGWDGDYDGDLPSFRMLNLARDMVGLVAALGLHKVAAVIGHDFGSPVAGWCAMLRPDLFERLVMMSAPFGGPPDLPFGTARADLAGATDAIGTAAAANTAAQPGIHQALAALARPRKHYQAYYSTRQANRDMLDCPQGLQAFLRAYYHVKSADWPGNRPFRLAAWTATELARLPTYYVMDRDQDMAATVAPFMPDAAAIAGCGWLPDAELAVYAGEYARTGFQGGLQWYRCSNDPKFVSETQLYAGRTIDQPACFIAGASDWGIHQKPGEIERMRDQRCTAMGEIQLIDGAGHWVQQEKPQALVERLLAFLR